MVKHAYDAVHFYMQEVASHVVAKSGIPSDRHHMGKLILHCLKEDPDFVCQIDGATGESETNGSVLDRSIRCAISLTALGLKKGDVMVLMGPNHLNYCIPHNAALYLGIMVACIDDTLNVNELKAMFEINTPKIIVGQNKKTEDIKKALDLSGVFAKIVTFDKSDDYTNLAELLKVDSVAAIKEFKPVDIDPEDVVAYLTSTSGTTGVPKTAMLTHKNLAIAIPYIWTGFTQFPTPTRLVFVVSPGQWLSAGFHYLFSPIMKYTRLQTSAPVVPEHFADLVNKYKPTYIATSPNLMTTMLINAKCDFSCFETVLMGGSAVSTELINEVKRRAKTDKVYSLYGMSELGGLVVHHEHHPAPGSNGRVVGSCEARLVDPVTNQDIEEPNVKGELWLRGPVVFKGYHNNLEVTKETLTDDGWFKSGDIFYRDESWNIFFVERYKLLLKYRNHQVSPVEIEEVIMKHPGVFHVAVTGIPDKECGDLVVACVVPKPGCSPTAQEIKDLVKGGKTWAQQWGDKKGLMMHVVTNNLFVLPESLTDSKQLRGGVVFMKELPFTSTAKVNRKKIKEMVLTLKRE